MPRRDTDRNLLFGILALQMDFVTRDDLVAAMNAWVMEKHRPLGEVLVDRGALDEAARAVLGPMVNLHVARHGGNPAASLAALGPARGVPADLHQSVADPDLLESIATLAPSPSGDPIGPRAIFLSESSLVRSRYRKVREHARGGLGIVFVAHDEELKREVALKEIQDQHADHPHHQARFLLEAEVTGGLEHPGIVPVYGLGHHEDGRTFYAMRFIRGESLQDVIARFHADEALGRDIGDRAFALQKLLRRFLDVCNAIDYAHSRGVLHRDIKPQNVMVGRYGETLVVDWGLAKAVGQPDGGVDAGEIGAAWNPARSRGSAETLPGSVLGTPAYMSPEQAAGQVDGLGPASDVYSLGATLYCLLTGRAPFSGPIVEVITRVQTGEFPRPCEITPWLDPALEAICLKAMSLQPEDRFASPSGLAGEIELWLAEAMKAAQIRRIDAAALETFAQVERLEIEARATSDPTRWAEAIAEARRAEAQVEAGAGSESLKVRIRDKLTSLLVEEGRRLDEIRVEQRDRRMISDLEEARLRGASVKDDGYDVEAMHAAYLAAFRTYGIDVSTLPEDDSAKRIRLSRIADELISALDQWANGDPSTVSRSQLMAVARAAETDPGRAAVREAVARGDADGLRRLCGSEQDRRGLGTAIRSVFDALIRLDPEESLPLLATIRRERPSDFWLNQDLGMAYLGARPPQAQEAVRCLSVAVALRPQSPGVHLNLGNALSELGRDEEAIDAYGEAIRLKPDYASAYNNLGNALKARGQLDEAVAAFRQAIRLRPDYAYGHHNLGNALRAQGKLGEAATAIREAIRLEPDLAPAHDNLGIALKARGQLDEAVAAFRQAIRLRPDHADAHHNLGVALFDQEETGEAVAAFRETIRLRPEYALGHYHLGRSLAAQGRSVEAIAAYREAIRLDPDLALAHCRLGLVLADQGELDEAIAACREAIRLRPDDAEAHNNLGNALKLQRELEEAVAAWREAIRLRPGFAEAHFNLGDALDDLGQPEEAIAAIREAIRLRPDYAEAHCTLGVVLRAQGQPEEAVAAWREAIRIRPGFALAHHNLGIALNDLGQPEEAIAAIREAIRLRPDYAEAHNNLGIALGERRELDEAVAAFREAIRLRPEFALAHSNLGLALAEQGKFEEAIAAHREAIRLRPEFALAHSNLGLALAEQGKFEEAIAAHREAIRLDPDDPAHIFRYNSACAAALAGSDRDDPPPDETASAELREMARTWLRADLAALAGMLDGGDEPAREVVAAKMAYWKDDADLAGVRDESALARMPEAEREALRSLWADVEALRIKAGGAAGGGAR